MADTGAPWNIPFVEPTDLVRDYPAADEAQALAVAAGLSAAGQVRQIVRATDGTNRLTSSSSFVDAQISVTITPTSANSNLLIIWSYLGNTTGGSDRRLETQITDASDTPLEGAESTLLRNNTALVTAMQTVVGFVAAGSVSTQTFKTRFRNQGASGNVTLDNARLTGQLYAIEVAP